MSKYVHYGGRVYGSLCCNSGDCVDTTGKDQARYRKSLAKVVKLNHTPTADMRADMMTKSLSEKLKGST